MRSLSLRVLPVAVVALASLTSLPPVLACPFCSMTGQTLSGEVKQAPLVLVGTLTNARLDAAGQGATDLHVDVVVKDNPVLAGRKMITLPRYVPTDNTSTKLLVFCDVYKGKIDPYRGMPVKADGAIVHYLQGALAVREKDVGTRLRYFFDYLDNADMEVSNDAYKEFGNASYNDYREMARHLPADKIAGWLADPATPSFRLGLYASMLGHCGTDRHAELLRTMLSDPQKRLNSGVDGIIAGYVMLKPREGWAYVRSILEDAKRDFLFRYAALRAVRFLWDSRPDLVERRDLVAGVATLLDQPDIADLAIEDLRKWERWEEADRVLALYDKPTHQIPIVRRAVLRYALGCPQPKAAALVEAVRKKDPETVKDVEELLRLEVPAPAKK